MTHYRPCRECGLPAEVIDGWVWHRADGPAITFFNTECPLGHIAEGNQEHDS